MSDPLEPINLADFGAPVESEEQFVTPRPRGTVEKLTTDPPPTARERLLGRKRTQSTVETESKPKKVVPNRPGQFVQPLEELYTGVAILAAPFRPSVSAVLMSPCRPPSDEEPDPPSVARNCALKWDEVAQKNETARRMIDSFLTISVWGALLAAHVPILVATVAESRFSGVAAGAEQFLRQQSEPGDTPE